VTASDPVVGSASDRRNGLFGRRGLAIAIAACILGGGTVLLATGRVWMHYSVDQRPLPPKEASATGHVIASPAATLALVVLAGVVVLPATRRLGRRAAGIAIALSGLGIGYLAVLAIVLTTDRIPGRGSVVPIDGRPTAWPWVALVAGALGFGAGLLAAICSARWPAMGRRYQSGSAKRATSAEASMWDRLDEGDDPTV
jgi:uncharacterized membrane protein (TIGR02234 family)